ncbi:DUF6382 domain-containing protein [Saccharibacillus qingshengii]|uniref:DUF6382 domain-containing protein n=1 Tax=Saccharibacillus qingshengii TaxID=1763540 RepID=UPI001555412F
MEEFVTDFVQSDTTYMVLKSKHKLGGDDLNRVQVKMLASSNVPHVLDLHVREVDAEVELHYNIGGKRMLSTCMRTEKITLVEYYALLLQIVTALEYGMTYMLNPNGFLLKEEYMFMDGPLKEGTVYLTYLPLNGPGEAVSSRERIGGLAARWMTAVDDLRGTGVQRILQMCEQPSFSLQSLKSLLIGLLAGSGKRTTGGLEAAGAAAPKPFPPMGEYAESHGPVRHSSVSGSGNGWAREENPGGAFPHASGHPNYAYNEAPDSVFSGNSAAAPVEAEEQERRLPRKLLGSAKRQNDRKDPAHRQPEMETPYEEVGSREGKNGRLVAPLIGLLLLTVLWKMLYMDNPGTGSLLICTVATPLLLVFAYLGWSGKLKFSRRGSERRQEEEEAQALASAWQEPRGASGHRVFYGRQEAEQEFGERTPGVPRTPQAGASTAAADRRNVPDFLRPAYAGGQADEDFSAAEQRYAMQEEQVHPLSVLPEAGTGMLASPSSQPTVMLGGGRSDVPVGVISGAVDSRPRYRLERVENGTLPKSIALPGGSFTIGRAADVSQHVETAVGISRAHVELELSGDRCTLKDIGSRNGTILNDEPITPYKAYELNEGDTFRIAGIAYTLLGQ